MRRFVLAVATAAAIAGGAAAQMAISSGTAAAQTPTQSPTPGQTAPAAPKRPCPHGQQQGSSGTTSTDAGRIGLRARSSPTLSV